MSENELTIKDHIKGFVKFVKFKQGHLYYITETDFEFPVPISEAGEAEFKNEEKGIHLMRYIRKHLDTIKKGNDEE